MSYIYIYIYLGASFLSLLLSLLFYVNVPASKCSGEKLVFLACRGVTQSEIAENERMLPPSGL